MGSISKHQQDAATISHMQIRQTLYLQGLESKIQWSDAVIYFVCKLTIGNPMSSKIENVLIYL